MFLDIQKCSEGDLNSCPVVTCYKSGFARLVGCIITVFLEQPRLYWVNDYFSPLELGHLVPEDDEQDEGAVGRHPKGGQGKDDGGLGPRLGMGGRRRRKRRKKRERRRRARRGRRRSRRTRRGRRRRRHLGVAGDQGAIGRQGAVRGAVLEGEKDV